MRFDVVVMFSPSIYFPSCLICCSEPVLVKAFISELAIETFNNIVLCWFSWLDKAFKATLPAFEALLVLKDCQAREIAEKRVAINLSGGDFLLKDMLK